MARVTVEDCLKNVKNRFELVMLAAKRARQLMRGKEPKLDWDNDKATVVALREIAAGYVNMRNINEVETHEERMHAFAQDMQAIDQNIDAGGEAHPIVPREENQE